MHFDSSLSDNKLRRNGRAYAFSTGDTSVRSVGVSFFPKINRENCHTAQMPRYVLVNRTHEQKVKQTPKIINQENAMKRFCTIAMIVACSLIGSQAFAQVPNLANTKWGGNENLAGFGKLEFQFHNGGKATMIDAKETSYGQWQLNQNKITISFYNGQAQYIGIINGNQMNGTATNGKTNWDWSVANMNPAPIQAPAPAPNAGPNANFKLTAKTLPEFLQKAGYNPKVETPEIGSPYCVLHVSDKDWNFVVEASVDAKGTMWLLMRLDQSADLKASKLTQLLEANNTVAPCFFVYRAEDTRICLKLECIGSVQDNMATLMRMTRESHSLWTVAPTMATK